MNYIVAVTVALRVICEIVLYGFLIQKQTFAHVIYSGIMKNLMHNVLSVIIICIISLSIAMGFG